MTLLEHLRTSARANRLANHRLHRALARLDRADFTAPRIGFFPSLAETLNHILVVDGYYLDALHRDTDMVENYHRFVPCRDVDELQERQARSDERLIRFVDALSDPALDDAVVLDRGSSRQSEAVGRVLGHLFMHQTHHRGQAHAMLSSTAVEPPPLDEFLTRSDAPNRIADMHELGWQEDDLFPTVRP